MVQDSEIEERGDDTFPSAPLIVHEAPSIYLWLAVLVSCLGTFSFGYALGFTSPVFQTPTGDDWNSELNHKLNIEMGMNSDQITWFGSVINLGAGFGAVFGGYPVDKFGKRTGMIIGNLFFVVSWIILLTVKTLVHDGQIPEGGVNNHHNMAVMYLSRIVMGFGIGFICCSTGNYQTEISTLKLRGAIGTCFQIGVVAGLLLVYALGLSLHWRELAIVGLCINGAAVVLTFFLPESPTWLMTHGRRDEAEAAMRKLRSSDSHIEEVMQALDDATRDDEGGPGAASFADLAQAPRGKALMIGIGLMFVQQLSGINAVMFYANNILGSVWSDPDTVSKVSVGVQALQLVVTISTSPIMDKGGRKFMLTIASVGMVVCCGLMNIYYFDSDNASTAWVITGFYGYVASFALGMGAIPWFIMGEIFHPEVKGISSSIATMANWLLSFAVTKTVTNLQSSFGGGNPGMGWVFTMYGSVCFLGIAFIQLFIPETKGKAYAEVEQELLGTMGYEAIDKYGTVNVREA